MLKISKVHRFTEDHLGFNATRTDAINTIDYLNKCGYPSEYGDPEKGEDYLCGIPDDVLMKAIEYAFSRWTVEITADGTPLEDFDTEEEECYLYHEIRHDLVEEEIYSYHEIRQGKRQLRCWILFHPPQLRV